MKKILDLVASHRHENQVLLSHITSRMQEQEQELCQLLTEYVVGQDTTISTKDVLEKLKVRDLEYWYTPLNELSGYDKFSARIKNALSSEAIHYLGELVIKTEHDIRLIPNFGKRTLARIKDWLRGLGEELGQELKEYRENEALLRYFDEEIADGRNTLMAHAMNSSQLERYRGVISVDITTVGKLATSTLVKTMMQEEDLQGIENYLKQWDENLRIGMPLPYWPLSRKTS